MGFFDLFKPDAPGSINRSNFESLITELQSDNPALHQKAKNDLQAMGEPALIPLLEKAIQTDNRLRTRIIIVLQELSGVSPLEVYSCMRKTCRMDRDEIIEILAVPGKNGVPWLLKLSIEKDTVVRSVAISALTHIGEPAIPILTKALYHKSYRVRSSAAETLTRMKWVPKSNEEYIHHLISGENWPELIRAKKIAVPFLIELLKDDYYGIRKDAAKTLGETGDVRALPPLIALLLDPESNVCISAIEALQMIKNETAIPPLITSLSHPSYNVRHMAATALEEFGWLPGNNDEKVHFLVASEQWQDLTLIGKPAIPYLIQILSDAHHWVRTRAATALKGMGKPGIDALTATLSHPDPTVRKMIEDVLNGNAASPQKNPGTVAVKSPVAVYSSQGKDTGKTPVPGPAGTGQKSPHDQPAGSKKTPEPEGASGQQTPAETKRTEPSREPDPIKQPSPSEVPKTREFVAPASRDNADPARQEREPDFSGLAQDIPETDTTQEEIAALINTLKNKDENIRTLAVDALGRIGVPAVDALCEVLRDPSMEVRLNAAEILGRIGNERAVQPLISTLKDTDEEVRAAAARSLGEIGEFSAFVPLIQTLTDSDPVVRQNAESALAAFGEPATEPIKKLTKHGNPVIRGSAAAILQKIGSAGIATDLAAMFSDPDEGVRERAAIALGELGVPGIATLAGILQSGDPTQRFCAVIGLGHAGTEATEYLVLAIRDESPAVRQKARVFLDALEKPGISMTSSVGPGCDRSDASSKNPLTAADSAVTTISTLIPLLAHQDKDLQMQAARYLVEMRGEAVPYLIDALMHENMEVQKSAAEILVTIGLPAIDPLITALSSPIPKMRMWAVQILGRIDDRRAVPHLIGQLREAEPRVRQTISETLGYIGDPEAIPSLTLLLDDPAEDVQISAARALGYIGHENAVPGLIGALKNEEGGVRGVISTALVEIGTPGIPHLVGSLCNPSREIRTGIAACLDQLGWESDLELHMAQYLVAKEAWIELSRMGEAALPPLRNALESSDEDLRMGAILTLVKMESSCAIEPLILALIDKNFLIRRKAMNALIDWGESARDPLIQARSTADSDLRLASEQVLERIQRKTEG